MYIICGKIHIRFAVSLIARIHIFSYWRNYNCSTPVRTPGVEVENTSSVSPACRERRLNGPVCRIHRIQKDGPVSVLDGNVKEPCKMSMALGARP